MKFVSEAYPQLRVNYEVKDGDQTVTRYVQFAEVERKNPNDPRRGEVETTDKAAIEALKALGPEYGVKAVGGRPTKSDGE